MIHFNPTIDLSCWWCRPLSKLSQGLSLSAYMCLCVCVCVFELFQSVSVISSTKDPAEIYKLVDWTIISTLDWWTRCHISIAFFEILKPSFVKTTSFKLAVATNEWQFFGAGPTCPWCELKAFVVSIIWFNVAWISLSVLLHCTSRGFAISLPATWYHNYIQIKIIFWQFLCLHIMVSKYIWVLN